MEKMLCQNCLCVRPYTDEGHTEEVLCECGGVFCGCPSCERTIELLESGVRDAATVGTHGDVIEWTAEKGTRC